VNASRIAALALWLIFALLAGFFITSYANEGIVYDLIRSDLQADEKLIRLQESFAKLGVLAPLVYLAMVTIEVVVAPIPGLMLYAPGGIIFGVWLGGALALAGNTLGAGVACQLARTLKPRWMDASLTSAKSIVIREKLERHGGWIIFFLRLNPLTSCDLISYVAGFTRIRISTVMFATALGMAPLCFAQSWLASELLVVAPSLLYLLIVALLVYLVVVGVVVYQLIRKPVSDR
jgi:uncharacterized membrane protein YdjX (TVP38/TMEM64 family)